jgi:hypothetical protein
MTLYIQDENYHFDGFISGVIVDNQRTAKRTKELISMTKTKRNRAPNWTKSGSL